ncbi:hypothetical protein ACWEGM_29250, partial [Streptomyces nigra]
MLAVAAIASGCAQGGIAGQPGGGSPAAGPVPSRSADAPASPPQGTRTPDGSRSPQGTGSPDSARRPDGARAPDG